MLLKLYPLIKQEKKQKEKKNKKNVKRKEEPTKSKKKSKNLLECLDFSCKLSLGIDKWE